MSPRSANAATASGASGAEGGKASGGTAAGGKSGGGKASGGKAGAARRSGRRLASSVDSAAAAASGSGGGGGGGGGGAVSKARVSDRHEERALLRVRALPCDPSPVVGIEEHATEERLRHRKLRPAANLPRTAHADATGMTPGPWTWAAIDTAHVGAALGAANAGTWLGSDAKCIDELLKLGGVKAKLKAKG